MGTYLMPARAGHEEMEMIALAIYLIVFFGSAILLILYINHDIVAEDKRYTAGIPEYVPEAPPVAESAPRQAA
ncbi:MAG TPA: hypothetical protein VFE37_27100 [Chloroflexota bacterium]|nr:hypothetical protein [Chloroflexota bacterium]